MSFLDRHRGFLTVLRREVARFLSIKRQTLLAPTLETYLYISIFGAALGSRIHEFNGVPYIAYIIPGLIMMTIAMNSFSNNASTILQQKLQRAIDDQLSSPVSNLELMSGYLLGGLLRGTIIATIVFITANLLVHLPLVHPLLFVVSLLTVGTLFASAGVLVGVLAETFDNVSFYQTFVIQPLIFLGGIFYSVQLLPPLAQTATHFNPIFYMINTVRYGMLGHSDANPYISLACLIAGALILITINVQIFKRGYKLRV